VHVRICRYSEDVQEREADAAWMGMVLAVVPTLTSQSRTVLSSVYFILKRLLLLALWCVALVFQRRYERARKGRVSRKNA